MNDITRLFLDETKSGLAYRIERSRYYVSRFAKNVEFLRIRRLEGNQPYQQFVEKRLGAEFDFIHRLGLRFERTIQNMTALDQNYLAMSSAQIAERTYATQGKIEKIAETIPLAKADSGNDTGKLVVLGWGSTAGAIKTAVRECIAQGYDVSHVHLRHMNPFPKNLGEVLAGYEKVLIPEMNTGQLLSLIRSKYLIGADGARSLVAEHIGLPYEGQMDIAGSMNITFRADISARARAGSVTAGAVGFAASRPASGEAGPSLLARKPSSTAAFDGSDPSTGTRMR